jgi:hypothetical protein
MSVPETQAAISAAVTPVVMISANAILISGITSKHQSMSDRVRSLTTEWRREGTPESRRKAIEKQLRLFNERHRWVTWSHIVLYLGTACFIAMVIVLAMSPSLGSLSGASLGLLIAGVGLTFLAILLELLDLSKARAALGLEVEDVKE